MKKKSVLSIIFLLIVGLFYPVGASCTEDVNSVVDANNQFAFQLYSQYKEQEGNILISPYSISTALAMVFEGARGKTADEMQAVFHFPKDGALRRDSFRKIIDGINKKDKAYQLQTANALWAQKDYLFLDSYLNLIKEYYAGGVTNLDFVKDTEKSRLTINDWVEGQTNERIKDLIPEGMLDPSTRLVITNAIYFKGFWSKQFDKEKTAEKYFVLDSGTTVLAMMMALTGEEANFNYTETRGMQVLELPYKGEDLSMLIFLPRDRAVISVEVVLDAKFLSETRSKLKKERVDVYLPRFKFETKYLMRNTLTQMGMSTAFSDKADFSGMTGNRDLFISQVIHQAFVETNEEGTEAAAATAAGMAMTVFDPGKKIKIFNADHPFIFIIQENETGNILFLGRVSNPR